MNKEFVGYHLKYCLKLNTFTVKPLSLQQNPLNWTLTCIYVSELLWFLFFIILQDMVAFLCCEYDGGETEKKEMESARERGWKGKFSRKGRIIRPGLNRVKGRCPLTPLEVNEKKFFSFFFLE